MSTNWKKKFDESQNENGKLRKKAEAFDSIISAMCESDLVKDFIREEVSNQMDDLTISR